VIRTATEGSRRHRPIGPLRIDSERWGAIRTGFDSRLAAQRAARSRTLRVRDGGLTLVRAPHDVKNHVSPLRFLPSAERQFLSEFEKGVRPR
jgi:hypothetical protein